MERELGGEPAVVRVEVLRGRGEEDEARAACGLTTTATGCLGPTANRPVKPQAIGCGNALMAATAFVNPVTGGGRRTRHHSLPAVDPIMGHVSPGPVVRRCESPQLEEGRQACETTGGQEESVVKSRETKHHL